MSHNRSFRNDRQSQPRQLRMVPHAIVATGADAAARMIVFTLGAPKVVLVKIKAKSANLGLPQRPDLTPEQRKEKGKEQDATAAAFGIDNDAYIDSHGKKHNGCHLIENAGRVRLAQLVAELTDAGYKLTHAVWFQEPEKNGRLPDPTHQFTFALEGAAIEMTDAVRTFLHTVYVDGFHLWCNPKMTAAGTPWRLDTLNGHAGPAPADPVAKPGASLHYAAPDTDDAKALIGISPELLSQSRYTGYTLG